MQIRSACFSDPGRNRKSNQDRLFASDAAGLYAVADGVGEASGPPVSELAMTALRAASHRTATEGAGERVAWMQALFHTIHAMLPSPQTDTSRAGPPGDRAPGGTTLSVLRLNSGRYVIGHVGDSRIYLLRDGLLRQLTRDHTLVEKLVLEGDLTRTEARHHPRRGTITRHLGGAALPEVDSSDGVLEDGDLFLLVTDGVTEHLDDDMIHQIGAAGSGLQRAAETLIRQANDAGGVDNMTVIAVRVIAVRVASRGTTL